MIRRAPKLPRRSRPLPTLEKRKSKAFALTLCAASGLLARSSSADIPPLDTHADDVTIDAKNRDIALHGNVTVDSPPFHLSSDALTLRTTSRGIDVDGDGKLAFCPCLGTPLTLGFGGAIVAPPGDLILKSPTLRVYGVPIAWVPYFWLRSPARVGLLPPDIAYRGKDGLFLGEGVHLPWKLGDGQNGLDLRAGAYTSGGSAFAGELRTPASVTTLAWDHKGGDGVGVDARGAMEETSQGKAFTAVTWNVDALRGARGVAATTDVDSAARVVDRAGADAALRADGWTIASGLRSASYRGTAVRDLGATGPVLTVRRADALRGVGDYDVTLTGGALRAQDEATTYSFARGEGGALLATRVGPVGASAGLRAAGDVADDGFVHGVDGAAEARGQVALPLARAFASSEPSDPWRHRIEPRAAVAALVSRGDDILGARFGRGLAAASGDAYLGEAGLASAFGRWGAADAIEGSVSVAGIGATTSDTSSRAALALRWRGAAGMRYVGLGAEGAHVVGSGRGGSAFSGRARVGRSDSVHLRVNAAAREGVDPVEARLLTDAALEPSAGFFATEGWSLGGNVVVPWASWVSTTGGIDTDLTNELLVAARGGLELRDKCQCLAVRLTGAHRIGREGLDVWLTIDLAPALRR